MKVSPKVAIAALAADPSKVKALFDEIDRLDRQVADRAKRLPGQSLLNESAEPLEESARPTTSGDADSAVEIPSAWDLVARIVKLEPGDEHGDALSKPD